MKRKHDLGNGHILVIEETPVGYVATLIGFLGVGRTEDQALDELEAAMRRQSKASADLARSIEPGGELHGKLQQIEQIVAIIEAAKGRS